MRESQDLIEFDASMEKSTEEVLKNNEGVTGGKISFEKKFI